MFKMKLKKPILREFSGYWWLFERNTYIALRCLKKKERRTEPELWGILTFDRFRFATLK